MSGHNRIIINNRTDLSDAWVLAYVTHVVNGGEISETAGRKHYCHLTTFKRARADGGDGLAVFCQKSKSGTTTFTLMEDPTK